MNAHVNVGDPWLTVFSIRIIVRLRLIIIIFFVNCLRFFALSCQLAYDACKHQLCDNVALRHHDQTSSARQ